MTTCGKTEIKESILFYLRRGKENAIKKKFLVHGCRCGERTLRLALRELLTEGHRICLSVKPPHYGYYIAETREEIIECMNTMQNYCIEAALHRRDLKRCLKTMELDISPVDNQYRLNF